MQRLPTVDATDTCPKQRSFPTQPGNPAGAHLLTTAPHASVHGERRSSSQDPATESLGAVGMLPETMRAAPEATPGPLVSESSCQHPAEGYLANRRSAASSRPGHTVLGRVEATELSVASQTSVPCLRLSMSSAGCASIVTKDISSPSPPRGSGISMSTMSSSDHLAPDEPSHSQVSGSADRHSLKRSSSGRSRDSRAWEFWCDKDARSELEHTAEKDASGSAADAISVLRSNSGRRILAPISMRRNPLLRPALRAQRLNVASSHRPLQRSSTSGARLPSQASKPLAGHAKPKHDLKHSEATFSVCTPGADSDKENWSPNRSNVLGDDRERNVYSTSRPALGSNSNAANRAAKSGPVPNNDKKQASATELADPENDAELAAFMKGGRLSNHASDEDELDCVQGLLSLSQGNWR